MRSELVESPSYPLIGFEDYYMPKTKNVVGESMKYENSNKGKKKKKKSFIRKKSSPSKIES